MSLQPPRGSASPLFPPAVGYALILSLMAAYIAGYAWSASHTDTADEIMRAYEIRHGLAYPAEGPFLGGALHLGPVWFYLAAIPLWISESWLSVAIFIGFVCSLKFPLAYFCGRTLIDRDFGFLWAAAMFVPGWNSLEQLVFLNPNAVATASLLVLAITLHGLERQASLLTFAALGFALAFAIHVHPTSAPFFLFGALLLWAHCRRGGALIGPIAAMATGFVVPFLPYVASQVSSGYSDWQSASTYMTRQVVPANVVNVLSVLGNYFLQGPAVMAEYLMDWPRNRAMLPGIALGVATLTSLTVFLNRFSARRARRPLLFFIAALFLVAAWISCMRPTTPFQFVWVLGPVVAGLIGIGFWSLAQSVSLRPVLLLVVTASLVFNCLVIRAMVRTVRDGEGRLPSRIMDIKGSLPHTVYRDVWFPALRHGELGRVLCSATRAVSLHGHLAYIADKDLGLDTLLACGERSRFGLAGSDPANDHYFGMTRPFWRALGWAPQCWVGSLGLTEATTPLLPRHSIALADGATYLPRRPPQNAPVKTIVTVRIPKQRAVLLTNVLGGYEYFEVLSALVAGQPVAPLAVNDLSYLFKPLAVGNDLADWTFTVMATNLNAVDVVSLENGAMSGSRRDKERICKDLHEASDF